MSIEGFNEIRRFSGSSVSSTVSSLEEEFLGLSYPEVKQKLITSSVDENLLYASFAVKEAAAQIDVIIHSAGILFCLPYILEKEEVITGISLGAGQGHGDFDLETSERIAEFKFIRWQRKGNAVRKKSLFQDYVKLALSKCPKGKYIYLPDTSTAMRFLNGRSNPYRLLDRNRRLHDAYQDEFGTTFKYVKDFHHNFSGQIKFVDLFEIVPGLERIIIRDFIDA